MASDLLTFEFVCKLSELPSGSKRCVELPTSHRSVMLLNVRGQVYCMDQACYRTEGEETSPFWW
jgi:nitrite reductase/ring-hydroxylating ferredoxin subunit